MYAIYYDNIHLYNTSYVDPFISIMIQNVVIIFNN